MKTPSLRALLIGAMFAFVPANPSAQPGSPAAGGPPSEVSEPRRPNAQRSRGGRRNEPPRYLREFLQLRREMLELRTRGNKNEESIKRAGDMDEGEAKQLRLEELALRGKLLELEKRQFAEKLRRRAPELLERIEESEKTFSANGNPLPPAMAERFATIREMLTYAKGEESTFDGIFERSDLGLGDEANGGTDRERLLARLQRLEGESALLRERILEIEEEIRFLRSELGISDGEGDAPEARPPLQRPPAEPHLRTHGPDGRRLPPNAPPMKGEE